MTAVYIIAGAMMLYFAYIIGLIYWDLLTKRDDPPEDGVPYKIEGKEK